VNVQDLSFSKKDILSVLADFGIRGSDARASVDVTLGYVVEWLRANGSTELSDTLDLIAFGPGPVSQDVLDHLQ